MDRLALSQRIKGLSEVFASENPIAQDLSAMSYVLENMSDEKFANVLNKEYTADKEAAVGEVGLGSMAGPTKAPTVRRPLMERDIGKPGAIKSDADIAKAIAEKFPEHATDSDAIRTIAEAIKKVQTKAPAPVTTQPTPSGVPTGVPSKLASEEDSGMYWNKEASDAVQNYLLKDVVGMDKAVCCDTGRQLDKEQMPDATKKQEKPATLKEEQTPKLSESLDSKIVEKAKAAKPVAKDAGKAEMITCPKCGSKVLKATGYCLKCKKKISESKPKDKPKKDKDAIDDSVMSSEGVELIAPMSEVKLSSEDEDQLSKLFG